MGSNIRADLAPITGLADALDGRLTDEVLRDISTEVERQVLAVGRTATGGDLRLSRYGKGRARGGARLAVDTKVANGRTLIELQPAGMWALAVGGADPHYIGPGSRTRGGKPRRRHPGSKGKGNAALDRVYAEIPDVCTEAFDDAIADRLR